MEKKDRFALFLVQLGASPAASTHDEAYNQLVEILNEVEDAYSGVPMNPAHYLSDGRLYPPQQDNAKRVPGRSDLVRYRSRRHHTWIAANGAIRIDDVPPAGRPSRTVLSKAGADGRTVEL